MARAPQPPRPLDKNDSWLQAAQDRRRWMTDLHQWLNDFWRASKIAAASGTTDGSGDLLVTHGMKATPSAVIASVAGTTFRQAQPHTITNESFKLRIMDAAGAAVPASAVTVYWQGGL